MGASTFRTIKYTTRIAGKGKLFCVVKIISYYSVLPMIMNYDIVTMMVNMIVKLIARVERGGGEGGIPDLMITVFLLYSSNIDWIDCCNYTLHLHIE